MPELNESKRILRKPSYWFLTTFFLMLAVGDLEAKPVSDIPDTQNHIQSKVFQPVSNILGLQEDMLFKELSFPTVHRKVRVYNINPLVGQWYLIDVVKSNGTYLGRYHIENPYPEQQLDIEDDYKDGFVLREGQKEIKCSLWPGGRVKSLALAKMRSEPFAGLCQDRLFLRNKIEGFQTRKEWVVQFLRENIWGGDDLTTVVKNTLYKDKFLIKADLVKNKGSLALPKSEGLPRASLGASFQNDLVTPENLAITLEKKELEGKMALGNWYKARGEDPIFVSVMMPEAVAPEILNSYPERVKPLDAVEAKALAYLVGFAADDFDIGYSLGTDHPELKWSRRIPKQMIQDTPGPDGFDQPDPLVQTGMINPIFAKRVAAAFTGGFKRFHGAFRHGRLSLINSGSHYGFVENGTVFSRLHPGLATIVIRNTGEMDILTWQNNDNLKSQDVKHARQNGVPLVEWSEERKKGIPGPLVGNRWLGNWSGNVKAERRTLRAGLCRLTVNKRRFLIYGYFSAATPNAMARVFQSYGCEYAIHMDMNAEEHTYMARYVQRPDGQSKAPEHLIQAMDYMDKKFKGNVPRFIGYPDNRDFFYLLKKPKPAKAH